MASSNEAEDDNIRNLNYDELDVYSKLEVKLQARNKIICRKEITLPCAHVEDTDLSDALEASTDPSVKGLKLHKRLEVNAQAISSLADDVRKVKRTSELEMDFSTDGRRDENDELSQVVARLRQQSEQLFKNIIHTQVAFNECLSSSDNLENKEHMKNHIKLIEKTCKYDRGLEAVLGCNKDTLEKHIDKNLKIDNVEEFKNVCNELTQGILTTTYNAGVKTYKNHEHLLATKRFNKPTEELLGEELIEGKLDPYTRQPITKPVCNKVCKHIYDQQSINQMFQDKLVISCPYIGCANKHFTKTDLSVSMNSSN